MQPRLRPTAGLRVLLSVVLALAAVTVLASATPCAACSCAVLPRSEQVAVADAVFVGTVTEVGGAEGGRSDELVPYAVTVTEVFKGQLPRRVTVSSEVSESSCGITLTPGDYLFFARGEVADLRVRLCDGTTPLAQADRSGLPTAYPPAAAAPEGTRQSGRSGLSPFAWGGLGLAVLGAVIGIVSVRWRGRRAL